MRAAIPQAEEAELLLSAYGMSERGNFEGKNILRRKMTEAQLAEQFHLPEREVADRLDNLCQRLLEVRAHRVRPSTDDKVLVSWNALMLTAFAEAGRALGRQDYVDIAIRNADFILGNLIADGHLYRSWRDGRTKHAAYLEDHAGLALGLLSLYQADPDPRWFQAALRLVHQMLDHFADPAGGFFDTSDDHEALLYRPKDLQDNATPCGNALAALALLKLAAFEGISEWRALAEGMISFNLDMILRYPTAFAQWLCAADFAQGPVQEVAILGDLADPVTQAMQKAIWSGYQPRMVLAAARFPPPEGSPALLDGRPLLDGKPTAYVCQGLVCRQPVNTVEEMLAQLEASEHSR